MTLCSGTDEPPEIGLRFFLIVFAFPAMMLNFLPLSWLSPKLGPLGESP